MTIFVLEVPHLGEPRCGVYRDWDHFETVAREAWCDDQREHYTLCWNKSSGGEEQRRDIVRETDGYDLSGYWFCADEGEARELVNMLRGPYAPRVGKCGPRHAADTLAHFVEAAA